MPETDDLDDDVELPDEYLLELGKIVVAWGQLESLLNHTLAYAMIDKIVAFPRALAAFAHMGFQQRVDALGAMLTLIEKEFGDLFRNDVRGRITEAQKGRNKAMHHVWESNSTTVFKTDIKARGKLKVTTEEVSIEELREILLSITKAYTALLATINAPLSTKFNPNKGK